MESQQQNQETQRQKNQRKQSVTQKPNQEKKENDQEGDKLSTQPGQGGEPTDSHVGLADPKALQENVWGQLPEQVRKRMQSRMVEHFLPAYRTQIEAYFQALLQR